MTRTSTKVLRSLALAATVSALAAPAASALPAELTQSPANGQEDPATPVRVVTVHTDSGFDWGDAGIGAAAGLSLMLVGAGSAIVVRRRPGRSALAS